MNPEDQDRAARRQYRISLAVIVFPAEWGVVTAASWLGVPQLLAMAVALAVAIMIGLPLARAEEARRLDEEARQLIADERRDF